MRIAIVETGAPPGDLKTRYGDYPKMIERMLSPLAPRFSFFSVAACEGEDLPPLDSFDAMLVTGSPAGVYEGHSWLAPLADSIRHAASACKPQVGICFGHQMMAQAFGGKVEKSEKGWGVGVHRYEVAEQTEWMTPGVSRLSCAASHQDQVIEPPKGARRLAGSDFCPYGILAYAAGPAISFQMHPEFDHDFATDLLRLRKDRIPEAIADPGLQSLKGRSDRALMAQWIANFYLNT